MASRARSSGDGESSEAEETLQSPLHQQPSGSQQGQSHVRGGERFSFGTSPQRLLSEREQIDQAVASQSDFSARRKATTATSSATLSDNFGDEGERDIGNARQQTPLAAPSATASGKPVSNAPQVAIKILVSNNASGSIIGRSGKTVSELQKKSMSRIKLSQSGDYYPGTSDRVCLIQGSLPNANVAVEMILRRLYQAYQQSQRPFSHLNDPREPGIGMTGSMPFIVILLVPTLCCGMLIGRGGSNIKSLKERTGVSKIQISPKENEAAISGAPAAIAAILSSTSERMMTITGPNLSSCVQCISVIMEDMSSNPEICRYINMTTSYTRAVSAVQSSFGISQPLAFSQGFPSPRRNSTEPSKVTHHPLSPMQQNTEQTFGSSIFTALPLPSGGIPLQEDPNSLFANQHEQQQSISRSSSEGQEGQSYTQPFNSGDMSSVILPPPVFDQSRLPSTQLHPMFPISQTLYSSVSGSFPQYQDPSIIGQPQQQWSPLSTAGVVGGGTSQSLQPPTARTLLPVYQLAQNFKDQARMQEVSSAQPQVTVSPQPTILQIAVPDAVIGSILGRGGKMLMEVQALSKTQIKISQRGEFIPGTRNRVVTITGPTSQSVATAQYIINQRLATSILRSDTGATGVLERQLQHSVRHSLSPPSNEHGLASSSSSPNLKSPGEETNE